MAGIDLTTAQAKLDAYLAAETKVLSGQKVEIDGETLTRADLPAIQAGINAWDARVKRLSGGRRSVRYLGAR
ncbi:hypothetical protein [Geopsychrobacter electrodiphilus]|uniref:hypothetical protein n=1 Tax=Geopsychrobacter electrodiphilus TaxID=225196 RepID=UPI0003709F72|nr:hypothetical protein [Geopsychrobacter electrodiphilus]